MANCGARRSSWPPGTRTCRGSRGWRKEFPAGSPASTRGLPRPGAAATRAGAGRRQRPVRLPDHPRAARCRPRGRARHQPGGPRAYRLPRPGRVCAAGQGRIFRPVTRRPAEPGDDARPAAGSRPRSAAAEPAAAGPRRSHPGRPRRGHRQRSRPFRPQRARQHRRRRRLRGTGGEHARRDHRGSTQEPRPHASTPRTARSISTRRLRSSCARSRPSSGPPGSPAISAGCTRTCSTPTGAPATTGPRALRPGCPMSACAGSPDVARPPCSACPRTPRPPPEACRQLWLGSVPEPYR